MIPWHQKKITTKNLTYFLGDWVTRGFPRPFISHGFLVDSSMVPTMTGGFHHFPGALVQSFSTFGSFIEGGDMEDRLVFRLKALERCQGDPPKKGLLFVFVNYAFLLSLCSVSFKEDVSGKMSDETWKRMSEQLYNTCLFWIASGREKKANHVTN